MGRKGQKPIDEAMAKEIIRITSLVEGGATYKAACAEVGIPTATYFNRRARLQKQMANNSTEPYVKFTTVESRRPYVKKPKSNSKVALVIGNPKEIAELLNEYI